MLRKFVSTFIFLFLCFTMAQSQTKPQNIHTASVHGVVYEQTEKEDELPVIDATVKLLNPSDSTVVATTLSDKLGHFSFPSVKAANYILAIVYISYSTVFKNISKEHFKENKIDLGKVKMEISEKLLSEVTVTGTPPDIVVKEDTVEYNAAAYKTGQNAVVEDLLKRLPGVEVDANGNIKAGGKDVKQVLVDGKEFFGKDISMSTKNIQVDIVNKVQVIDRKTEAARKTGVEDGEKETVINLALKPGMNKGWIGNASIGAGALVDNPTNEPARYSGNAMLSKFKDGDNLSFTFNSNNVNNQFFGGGLNYIFTDGMMSMGGGGFSSSGGGGGGGITNSTSIGMNVSKSKDKKMTAGGSASYGYSDSDSRNKSFRQNILIDSVSYTDRKTENRSYSNRISLNAFVDYKLDTLNSLTLNTSFTYGSSNSRNNSFQSTMAGDADSTKVNQSESSTINQSDTWSLSMNAIYSRRFAKRGRQFSLSGGANINRNDNNGNNRSISQFFLQPGRNQYLDQEIENNTSGNNFNFKISHVEPVWKDKNTIQLAYSIDNNRTTNIRDTYDYDPETGTYSILNPTYSKSLDNNYINQKASVSFNSNYDRYTYNIGFNLIPSYTESRTFVKNGSSDGNDSILNKIDGRSVMNYSPQARFTYKFKDKNKSGIFLNYTGNTRQPSVQQLDPTVDNTNPLYIRSGNPNLLPSFMNMFILGFSSNNQQKQQYINANINGSFTQNEIIYFTDYEESTGIQYSKPINENGSWNSSANIMYGRPLDKKNRLKMTNVTFASYSNRIGYMMVNKKSERNVSGTLGLGDRLSLSYTRSAFYGQLSGNINYSKTSNSQESQAGRESTSFGLNYNTSIKLPKDWSFASDINYRGNRGLSAGYNNNVVLWNMEISKQFLKKKQANISLKWNDILRENVNIMRNVSANYIEDSEFNALSSYFMVAFSYRLTQMGGNRASAAPSGAIQIRRQ